MIQTMGIPERKKRERQRRRQQIITAARRVFADQGIKNATMHEIAREAELSPGTLYLYFKSKKELNAALALQTVRFLKLRLGEIQKRPERLTLKVKFKALRDALYDLYQFEPIGLKCFFTLEPDDLNEEMASQFCMQAQKLHNGLVSQIAEFMRDDIKRVRLPHESAEDLADLILSLFCGIVMQKRIPPPSGAYPDCNVKASLETAFDVLLRGLRNQTR